MIPGNCYRNYTVQFPEPNSHYSFLNKSINGFSRKSFHYERSGKDLDGGYSVRATGGMAAFATLGAEISFSKCTFGGNFQPVLFQDLGSGAVQTGNRSMIHFSLLL